RVRAHGALPCARADKVCRSPASLLAGNHSSLRVLCHPFRALAPGGGRGGLGGEDGHSVLHWRQYSRKSKAFPYIQEIGNLSQKSLISTLLDKTRPSRSVTRGDRKSVV